MAQTIHLHTKDNKTFWAKDGSNSEILAKHLIGTRYIDNSIQMDLLEDLAAAHGWLVAKHLIPKEITS